MPQPGPPTPARAASAAGRPKTRLWTRRLEASLTDAEERDKLREDASKYLDAADAAARRGSGASGERNCARNMPPVAQQSEFPPQHDAGDAAVGTAGDAATVAVDPAPAAPAGDTAGVDALVAALAPGCDWNGRVAAMKTFSAAPSAALATALAPGIAAALGDLRSQVTVAAADAAEAAAPHAPGDAAAVLVGAGLAAAVKTKAVIASSGRRAALAQLVRGAAEERVWRVVVGKLRDSPSVRERACAVECLANADAAKALLGGKHENGKEIMGEAIAVAVVDRAAEVRNGGKGALERLLEICGKKEAEAVVEGMSVDAKAKAMVLLKSAGDAAGGGVSNGQARGLAARRLDENGSGTVSSGKGGAGAAAGGKPSLKEMIRRRRLEAQRAAKEAKESTEEVGSSATVDADAGAVEPSVAGVVSQTGARAGVEASDPSEDPSADAQKKRNDLDLSPQKALSKRRNVASAEEKENLPSSGTLPR